MNYTNPLIAVNKSLSPLADHKSRVLILDTMPSEKSKILSQYYVSKSNYFWKIMFRALREPQHADYKMKKQMLLNNGVALWNVLEGDNSLAHEQSNDFETFFQRHSTITKVLFNGNNAAECYAQHVGYRAGISFIILPSSSSLNTWKSFEEKVAMWTEELRKI